MSEAIKIRRLTKKYSSRWPRSNKVAVNDLSLEVSEGEVFGFVGANGAGKSTTIKVLIGAIRPTEGTAHIMGVGAGEPLARQGLGYVPENPSLYSYLTPLELLKMGLQLHSVKVDNANRHCMEWLERFDLASVADKRIEGFSKGMVQRTTLAHAMAIRPKLLILDEPLSGLDPVGRRDVVNILADYKSTGGAIFFTSHVLHDVERLADRVGLMHQGSLRAVYSTRELFGQNQKIVIRTSGSEPVGGMTQVSPDQWQIELPKKDAWGLIDELKNKGHLIDEIKPASGLENIFLSIVESGRATGNTAVDRR